MIPTVASGESTASSGGGSSSMFWPWASVDSHEWLVQKFGGTSMGSADCFAKVKDIVLSSRKEGTKQAVVVSAMSGVTSMLIEIADLASKRDCRYLDKIKALDDKHTQVVKDLVKDEVAAVEVIASIRSNIEDIKTLLRSIYLTSTCSEYYKDIITGHGEMWSSRILSKYMALEGVSCDWLDAREVLCVKDNGASVSVAPDINWELSNQRYKDWFQYKGKELEIIVITGYIAAQEDGRPATLKRNGSDYSASIFGNVLNAKEIRIWTDVDGVYSADPRKVQTAKLLRYISYSEAVEFSFYGAKIIHPKTMSPAEEKKIPIYIRNTFNPTCPGTKIHIPFGTKRRSSTTFSSDYDCSNYDPIRGLCSIDNISLLTVISTPCDEDDLLSSPLGVRNHIMSKLQDIHVPLIAMAQAAPMHSVCFCVPKELAADAYREITNDQDVIRSKLRVEMAEGFSIVTAVGDLINAIPGLAATFFSALASGGINVLGIAQNGERIISVLLEQMNLKVAMEILHSSFKVRHNLVNIGLVLDEKSVRDNGGNQILARRVTETICSLNSMVQTKAAKIKSGARPVVAVGKPWESQSPIFCVNGILLTGKGGLKYVECKINSGASIDEESTAIAEMVSPSAFWENIDLEKQLLDETMNQEAMDAFFENLLSPVSHHSVVVDLSCDRIVACNHSRFLTKEIHVISFNFEAFIETCGAIVSLDSLYIGWKDNAGVIANAHRRPVYQLLDWSKGIAYDSVEMLVNMREGMFPVVHEMRISPSSYASDIFSFIIDSDTVANSNCADDANGHDAKLDTLLGEIREKWAFVFKGTLFSGTTFFNTMVKQTAALLSASGFDVEPGYYIDPKLESYKCEGERIFFNSEVDRYTCVGIAFLSSLITTFKSDGLPYVKYDVGSSTLTVCFANCARVSLLSAFEKGVDEPFLCISGASETQLDGKYLEDKSKCYKVSRALKKLFGP